MVKNSKILKAFEEDLMRKTKPDYRKNVRIANALLRYARGMGKFSSKKWREEIEIDIRYAKAINSVR